MGIKNVTGWGPLLGIPALFVFAYFLGLHPRIVDIPVCGVRMFLGVVCPGCGLTHSIVALAHGRVRESVYYHPLGLVIAVWLVYVFMRSFLAGICHRPIPRLLTDRTRFFLLNFFVAVLIAQWIIKLIVNCDLFVNCVL